MQKKSFEARLENWGDYFRDRTKPGESMTYKICESMADKAGQRYRESTPRPEIDVEDAQTIEYCWAMSAHRIDTKHRALLRAYYVECSDVRMVARVLRIRWLSFEDERMEAVRKFEQVVALMECVGNAANALYSAQTTRHRLLT